MNAANRIEAAAKPGQTLINKATYNLVKNHIIADELEAIKVKGREEKIHLYNLRDVIW